MNLQKYIESGILESYCLGVLNNEEMADVEAMCRKYPQLNYELKAIELALEKYAEANAMQPKPGIHDKIARALINMEKEKTMNPNDLPLISKYSNYKAWLRFVKDKMPAEPQTGRTVQFLQRREEVVQMLLVSATDFEEEVHDDLHESFLILEGECECFFGENVFKLKAGGFAEVPLFEPHSVRMITPYVVAILQRVTA